MSGEIIYREERNGEPFGAIYDGDGVWRTIHGAIRGAIYRVAKSAGDFPPVVLVSYGTGACNNWQSVSTDYQGAGPEKAILEDAKKRGLV